MLRAARLILVAVSTALVTIAILAQWRGLSFHFAHVTIASTAPAIILRTGSGSHLGFDATDETVNRIGYLTSGAGRYGSVYWLSLPWWIPGVMLALGWTAYFVAERRQHRRQRGFPIVLRNPPDGQADSNS
jgi:hypothetical protein